MRRPLAIIACALVASFAGAPARSQTAITLSQEDDWTVLTMAPDG
jgi:hypothetical protein